MNTLKLFFKDTAIYGLGTVLPRLISLFLVPLYTYVFENESYSENTEFYIVAAFFNVILTYGLETSFFRFFSRHKEKNKVISTALISISVSSLMFGVILFVFNQNIAQLFRINTNFYNILVAITLIDTMVVIPFAYLRVTGKPIKFGLLRLCNVLIVLTLNILLLSKTYSWHWLQAQIRVSSPIMYVFVANLIASSVILIMVLPYILKVKLQFDLGLFKKLLGYGLPIMVAGLAFVINENLDKWLLPNYEGKYINGAYSACYKLAAFMTLFIQAFRMGAEPFFFNYSEQKDAKQTYAIILKYFTIVGALGLMIITVYINLLSSKFIQNESYMLALDIVPIIVLANLFLGIYHNLSVWYKLTDKTKFGMYISIIGAVITISFNIIFIPKLGFMACAYATLLAYGCMMLVSFLLGKKHYPVPYDINKISMYLAVATLFSFVSYYNFNKNIIIGSILLLIFVTMVYLLEKKELQQWFKSKS